MDFTGVFSKDFQAPFWIVRKTAAKHASDVNMELAEAAVNNMDVVEWKGPNRPAQAVPEASKQKALAEASAKAPAKALASAKAAAVPPGVRHEAMAWMCTVPVLMNKRTLEAGTELSVLAPPRKVAKPAAPSKPKPVDLRKVVGGPKARARPTRAGGRGAA